MDNPSRSERSKKAALQAALTIISRDGPAKLTLDAIARESGMSKGAVTHQFRSKEAVLKALLDKQMNYFADFSRQYREKNGTISAEPELATQIATLREVITQPHSVAFAILGAMAQDPGLLEITREHDATTAAAIKAEAADPQLAVLRWYAARGLALSTLFGLCSLNDKERNELFDRLSEERQWAADRAAKPAAPKSSHAASRKGH